MWVLISRLILRNRILILILLAGLTGFMAYEGQYVDVSYRFGGLLPKTDSTYVKYLDFKEYFNEDGNIFAIGVKGEEFYSKEHFNAWYDLGNDLKKIEGVDSVFSEAHLFGLKKKKGEKGFTSYPVMKEKARTDPGYDSLMNRIRSLPFYKGLVYNDTAHASLMLAYMDREVTNSEQRKVVVNKIKSRAEKFASSHVETHYSGLPYIRTVVTTKVNNEMRMFVVLAILVTSLILFFFFRSLRVVVFSMLVVGVGVIWSLGTIALFEYKLTIVMALIPPLIIVIGIPNCVFLLNKYHNEFVKHGNKIKAIQRKIQKIGNATFLTNTTTALGFATFIFTESSILQEFGVIAAINIMAIFLFSLLIIPIVYSFMPEPKKRHTKHLDRTWMRTIIQGLLKVVTNHRKAVYITTGIILILGFYGLSLMRTSGKIVDDLPKNDPVLVDLQFFQKNFNGVLPFEVYIDTKKKGHASSSSTIRRISRLQDTLAQYPQISATLSIADAMKFARQAFFNGDPRKYGLIRPPERRFIGPYLTGGGAGNVKDAFLDSTRSKTRITGHVADIGTQKMADLTRELEPKIDSIFPKEKYDVALTGISVVFFKGTSYLVKNLFISLSIAIFIIACIMAFLFNSFRMVILSLIPNLIPLLLTAALMGYFGITIKPSTVLVFSIAFGISVDDTIHYLAKYRQELNANSWDLRGAVLNALRETGVSMFYTSIVLFFGFSMFIASDFGGTQAIGILVSITLLIAMLSNLVLLPSMLLSLERHITTKAFQEPLLELMDEEEDIELEDLKIIEKNGKYTNTPNGSGKDQNTDNNPGSGQDPSINKEQ